MSAELLKKIYEMLPQLDGWCNEDKSRDLVQVVTDRKPQTIVEIGIFGGRSLFVMAMAQKLNGSGVTWGIDPWSVEAAAEGENAENVDWWTNKIKINDVYQKFVVSVLKFGLLHDVNWVRDKSSSAAKLFDDGSIDFLHLDANHSELASCNDVRTWSPKLKQNSIWIMDDADWASQAKAMQMIRDQGFRTLIDRGAYMIFER